jgi:ADP-ribose pyrophosphatase
LFGPHENAGVKILLDRDDIERVEDEIAAQLKRRGLPERGAEIGIVAEDPWVYLIRDAVEFPDGSRRAHARIINRGADGSAVLPLFDEKIVLTRQFRHAIRRWSLEIPRGAIESGQSPEDAARAEVREEIGGEIDTLQPLGFMHGSTNIYANGAHLFFATLTRVGQPQLEEAITSIEQVSIVEFEKLITSGEIVDSFTLGAFTHARLRGFL